MKNLILIIAIAALMTSCGKSHKKTIENHLSWVKMGDSKIKLNKLSISEMNLVDAYSFDSVRLEHFHSLLKINHKIIKISESSIEDKKAYIEWAGEKNDNFYINAVKKANEELGTLKSKIDIRNQEVKSINDSISVYSESILTAKDSYFVYDVDYSFENPLTKNKAIKSITLTVGENTKGSFYIKY